MLTKLDAARLLLIGLATAAAGASAAPAGIAAAADPVRIEGSVVDRASGEALTGFEVEISDAAGVEERTSTGKNGRYAIVGAFSSPITLTMARGGYRPGSVTVAFSSGDSLTCDFQGRPTLTTISGRGMFGLKPDCRVEPRMSDTYIIQ
jgi:hypothetical protein